MEKTYSRINFQNSPTKTTPLSAANLNQMDKAIDELDNRSVDADGKIKELKGRMDAFTSLKEGSTTGDAELTDGRVDYEGNVHTNIGEHIREVSSQLSSEIGNLSEKTLYKDYISIGKNDGTPIAPTFKGYCVPIKKNRFKKVCVLTHVEQTNAIEDVTITCRVTDNNDVTLGETTCTVTAKHYVNSLYQFVFDEFIDIPSEYGYLYISCPYKMAYASFTDATINKDVVYDFNSGVYSSVSENNETWYTISKEQSYQFCFVFELFNCDYVGSIPIKNQNDIADCKQRLDTLEDYVNTIDDKVNTIDDKVNTIIVSSVQELKDAIDSIATTCENNKANCNNRYVIKLNSGVYDIYSVLKKSGYVDQEKFNRGLEIPDYVSLVGVGNVTLECNIPNSDNGNGYYPTRIISVINTYGENSFENINFVATNCRYCVHDDNGGNYKNRTIYFKNCTFVHNGVTVNNKDVWNSACCYGAGYTAGRKGIFENCSFESNDYTPFYIHSSSDWYMTDKFEISIKNCAFITQHEVAIDLQDAYGTDLQGVAHIDNCYITSKIRFSGTKPWSIYGGGNSKVEISNENNSKVYIVN